MRPRPRRATTGEPGFTLMELLIVMVIIGIILAFILKAATDGVRRAEEKGTQALIAKLDAGMADRLDAVLSTRLDANDAHVYLANAYSSSLTTSLGAFPLNKVGSISRAQVIARFDQIKAEFPDVFVVQNDTNYPINFAAAPFPANAGTASGVYQTVNTVYDQYLLPFGIGIQDNPAGNSLGANPGSPVATTGIFGASYTAAAGIYKNLVAEAVRRGATPPSPANRGYDGVDNDGNGLVDDLGENGASVKNAIVSAGGVLSNHTHKTARAEMLYALLVEGQGPFGSVFNREDFRDTEIRDTDGDGLPEFVDAWGEPIQYYRWPVHYVWPVAAATSAGTVSGNTQKGFLPYTGVTNLTVPSTGTSGTTTIAVSTETRQLDTLDASQTLMNPSWWGMMVGGSLFNDSAPYLGASNGSAASPLSASAFTFQEHFTTLTDPNGFAGSSMINTATTSTSNPAVWDRGGGSARRAYYSRFLILSGGPDKTPGVPVFDAGYYNRLSDYLPAAVSSSAPAFSGQNPVSVPSDISTAIGTTGSNAYHYLRIESQAAPGTYTRNGLIFYEFLDTSSTKEVTPPTDALSLGIQEAGNDDITSQNLQGLGGVSR